MQSSLDSIPDDLIDTTSATHLIPGQKPGKRIDIGTLYRWLRCGLLRAWKVRRRWMVSKADVLGLLRPANVEQDDAKGARTVRERAARTDEVLRRAGIRR